MKTKQSYSIAKQFALPIIRNLQQKRITPRHKVNNRSLPKIAPTYGEQIQQTSILNNHKPVNYDKKSLKQKLKSVQRKKKHFAHLSSLQNQSNIEVDEANITSQFQKQIQKNLMLIKKQKQDNKNHKKSYNKPRYNSPRSIIKSFDDIPSVNKQTQKLITDQDVFLKINEIIMNSQSKSSFINENQRNISFSAFVKDQNTTNNKPISKYNSRQKLKTQPHNRQKNQPSIVFAKNLIKHNGNYNEWRKLSIDSAENGKIKYDISSYEMQTDRLQKIRSKNDLSLKKYFEGKNYLNQLVNYRDSSSLLSKKE